jgi:hypothetical protein
MTAPIPYLMQGKNIILVVDGKSHTISKDTHMSYAKIVDALKAKDWDALHDLVEPKRAIVDFGAGNVSIDGEQVFWKGKPFHNALANRMIDMYKDGFPIDPMVRFMENLMANPSKRSVDQVYSFLEKNSLPITEDGHFLAYKKVRADYLDIHSGTIDNSIGQVVEMDRNLVDDDPNSYCSSGLHFCSESYLAHFGGSTGTHVMILKINPADVVSVPNDYNGAKGRCAKYEVIAEVDGDPKTAFSKAVDTEYNAKSLAAKSLAAQATEYTPSAWPFPSATVRPAVPAKKVTTGLFDLVRVYSGALEYTGLTEDEADAQIDANIRGKKAQLKKVPSGS